MTTALPEHGDLGVEGHAQVSHLFLEHAGVYLRQGDRIQASEKVWGAAAHALKAIGERRGWVHSNHSHIFDIGGQIGREFGQEQRFLDYLSQAQAMHQNFYDNIRDVPAIQRALSAVMELVEELDAIRNSPPRRYTIQDADDRIRLGHLLGLRRGDRPPIGDSSSVGYSQTHRN
jgi:hypothetical protein